MSLSSNFLGAGLAVLLFTSVGHTGMLKTDPPGAAVFQKVRGKHRLIGYTPLKLSASLLAGKSSAKLMLLKYGYEQKTLSTNLESTTLGLNPIKIPAAVPARPCELKLLHELSAHLKSAKIPFHVLLPVIKEAGKGGYHFLLMRLQIVNHEDSYAIRRTYRLKGADVLSTVSQVIEPTVTPILKIAGKGSCLDFVHVDVEFQASKRLAMKSVLTPTGGLASYHWYNNFSGEIYRTTVNYTWSSQNLSHEVGIAVDRKKKTVSLRYEL